MTTGAHLSDRIIFTADQPPKEVLAGYGRCSRHSQRAKRLLDLGLILIAAPFVFPIALIIALAIKASTPGPIFFKQDRMGARLRFHDGKLRWELQTFKVYKFRSMFVDADQSLHRAHIKAFVDNKLADQSSHSTRFKIQNDPRITPIGRLLRRSSLDELPQLINVIRGEMSLVGPRPIPLYEVAEYNKSHFERLAALPGLTGLWQVEGRGRVTFDEMMAMDIAYVRHQNPFYDLKLLIRTIPVVLTGRGAR